MKLADRIRSPYAVALLTIGAALSAFPASAQTVIGDEGQPDVVVDYSVLEELGPPLNVPQVLMPRTRAQPLPAGTPQRGAQVPRGDGPDSAAGRITLTPPDEVTPRRGATKPVKRKPSPPKVQAKAPAGPKPEPPAASAPALEPVAPPPAPPPRKASAPKPEAKPAPMAAKPPEPRAKPPAQAAPVRRDESSPAQPSAASPPPPAPSKPAETETAKSDPAPEPPGPTPIAPGRSLRVGFDSGSAKLSRDANRQLERIAEGLARDDQLRVRLLAYADGTSQTASQARRLSLSRALAARSFLIGEGVRSTRIDVRALGNKSEGGPPDRIDVIITKR